MKQSEYVLNNEKEVLEFLRTRYPMYHRSNIFFRDVHFGIQQLLETKQENVDYTDAEKIAQEFIARLEREGILTPLDHQTWVLNYPEFKTPVTKAPPAAKPAAPAPGATPARPKDDPPKA